MSSSAGHYGHRQRGFSLAEVALSIGILATGLLILIALLPPSIGTLQDAASRSVERRIAQNIVSEIMLGDWDQVSKFSSGGKEGGGGSMRIFDEQGIELNYPKDMDKSVFTVRIRIPARDVQVDQDGTLEKALGKEFSPSYTLEGESTSDIKPSTALNLRRILVDITSVPDPNFDFAEENRDRYRTYATIVSNIMDNASLAPRSEKFRKN